MYVPGRIISPIVSLIPSPFLTFLGAELFVRQGGLHRGDRAAGGVDGGDGEPGLDRDRADDSARRLVRDVGALEGEAEARRAAAESEPFLGRPDAAELGGV